MELWGRPRWGNRSTRLPSLPKKCACYSKSTTEIWSTCMVSALERGSTYWSSNTWKTAAYMTGFILQPNKALNILSWGSRMKICYQVACALEYLHHHTTPPIVHRDIKSANILLTLANDAKLADFGLSKSAPTDALSFESIQTDVKGSLGYLDPKYVRSGVFSTRSDVYSYGVVLLEIITGHRAIKDSDLLPVWAAPYLSNPAMASDMVDERLGGHYDSGDLAMLVELATMCLQDESEMRPSMQQVVSFYTERHLTSALASHENEAQDVSIDMDSQDSSLDTTSPVRPLDSPTFTTFTSSLQFQGR